MTFFSNDRAVTITETVHVSTETTPSVGDSVQREVAVHGDRGVTLSPVPVLPEDVPTVLGLVRSTTGTSWGRS